jgi:hypothetical protein
MLFSIYSLSETFQEYRKREKFEGSCVEDVKRKCFYEVGKREFGKGKKNSRKERVI